jgi:hypothetical protein
MPYMIKSFVTVSKFRNITLDISKYLCNIYFSLWHLLSDDIEITHLVYASINGLFEVTSIGSNICFRAAENRVDKMVMNRTNNVILKFPKHSHEF